MLPSVGPQLDSRRQPEFEIPASNMNITSLISGPPTANECDTNTTQNPKVIFSPPLYEQRRAWILGVLRHEQVTSVSTYNSNAFECSSNYNAHVSNQYRIRGWGSIGHRYWLRRRHPSSMSMQSFIIPSSRHHRYNGTGQCKTVNSRLLPYLINNFSHSSESARTPPF